MLRPERPRAKRIAPPKSDWSPRPIPQAAEPLHTADPPTLTLRELEERERRRASLVMPVSPVVPPDAPPRVVHFPPGLPATLDAAGACAAAWGAFGREAQDVLQAGGPGDGDADPIARNRAISRAYAQFYERNPKLEWAGIASIVSSNAGCAMRHANAIKANAEREIRDMSEAQRYAPPVGDGPSGAEFLEPSTRAWAVGVAHDALADGNKEIFRNIYPALRMHERYGDAGLSRCATRSDGARVSPQIRDALSRAYSEDPDVRRTAGNVFADYEQKQVLEAKVMHTFERKTVFLANQLAAKTAVGRALGAQAPDVRLTSGCNDGTPPVRFEGSFNDPDTRAAYYRMALVPAFTKLRDARRTAIIAQLAGGRAGVAP